MNALPRGLAFRFLLHEFVFQLRYQSLTFSYLTGAFSLPITYAVILKILGDTAGKPAFGAATIAGVVALGAIEVVTVQIVLATLNDKHAGMLDYRLAAPVRFDLAALGRYGAIVVQSLVAYPVVMISAALLGGLDPANDYLRLSIAVLLICVGSVGLFSLLGYVILRYPFSPGMANGWPLLVVALGGVFGVPQSGIAALSWISFALPYRAAREWAETGSAPYLPLALVVTTGYGLLPLPLARRFDVQSRQRAVTTNV